MTISVAKGADGNVVYNIRDIDERSFPDVTGSSAKGGALNGETSSKSNDTTESGDVKTETKNSIESDYIPFDQRAVLKESTAEQYLRDYAAPSSPNYAQAYIAYIRLWQFLRLTTSIVGRFTIEEERTPLDAEHLHVQIPSSKISAFPNGNADILAE